jgi:branched-chain amino acid transport system substrate-binding protein
VAVQVANQVLAGKPKVILGSALVAMCNAMGPLMRNGPVLYCLSPSIHPQPGSYVFSASVSTTHLYAAILTYYRLRGWTRIAVLTSTDATGQVAENDIRAAMQTPENQGLEIVASERFNPTDVSADAQIQRMKAAAPQAIITSTSGTPLGTILRALGNAAWDVPVVVPESNMLHTQMKQYAGITPKQLFYATGDWLLSTDPGVPQAVKDHKNRMFAAFRRAGIPPDEAAGLAWDPALITVAALRALPEEASPAQLRAHIAGLTAFPATLGLYDFPAEPQRGIGVNGVVMARWNAESNDWSVISHPGGAPLAP